MGLGRHFRQLVVGSVSLTNDGVPAATRGEQTWSGSQPRFSLNPAPDQHKEDTSFISILTYYTNIPLSRLTQICILQQNFERSAKDHDRISEPWIQDPKGFCPFPWGFNCYIKDKPAIKHHIMENQAQRSEVP